MKRINLLTKQKKYTDISNLFFKLKYLTGFIVLIFLLSYIFFAIVLSGQQNTLSVLESQKKSLLEYLLQNKQVEAKFVYFRSKERQLSEILKDDVNFYPYYNLLQDSLKSSSPEAALENVVIDKNKTVTFSIGFKDNNSMLDFFKFAESDEFLKNFSQLILNTFSSSVLATSNSYKLEFKGVFSQLNETAN